MNEAEYEAEIVDSLKRMGTAFQGVFVDAREQQAIERLIQRGQVKKIYQGAGGFLGLAKIHLA